jgi:16S rRNA (cytosine967-C5)-methyltransferase
MKQQAPLSEQLAWTARTVQAVQQGRSLNDAMPKVPQALRPGVQALTFHALRHWGQATAWLGYLAERTPSPQVGALLGVALTLLADEQADQPRYAAHTVVDQAVQSLAVLKQPRSAAGFVNACLRRFLREKDECLSHSENDAVARWNHPFWWIRQLRRDHPQHWQAILQANNEPAPMTIRVNRRKQSRDAYLALLQGRGVSAIPVGEDGLELSHALPVDDLPGWNEGWVSVQDAAAQLAAPLLLGATPLPARSRVLDACAAPGGKTAHLLERADFDLLALDVDPKRCQRIHDNLARLGLQADVRAANAGQPAQWWDGQPFDAILLDAPCTASGIVRRHPDVRWLRRQTDVDQLAEQQRLLLNAMWPLLKPEGVLLYCTCSVFKAEGDLQIERFIAEHSDAWRLPAPGHILPGRAGAVGGASLYDNASGGMDGFYYALLQKRPPA